MASEDKPIRDGGVAVDIGSDVDRVPDAPDVRPRPLEDLIVGENSDVRPVVSVVMPTLNEEQGIPTCIDRIERAVLELGVPTEIIVSDSSTDRTPDIARTRGAIVVEPDRPGYGYAYRYAFEHVRGDYVVIGDADTTYDFTEVPRFLDTLVERDADIVMGSRLEGQIEDGAMPALHQYIGNPLLTRFLNTFYDAGVTDAHSGFRVFRRSVLEDLSLRSDGMEFASEMIMEASTRGLRIEEVPITYHQREGEATLESFRDGWRHVRFMLVNAPGYIFSVPAAVLCVVGASLMLGSFWGAEIFGITIGAHTAILGSLMTIVGFQVGCLAVFSSVAANPIRRTNDTLTAWIRERISLEQGTVIGVGLFALGTGYLGIVFVQWLTTGGSLLTQIVPNMIAFTAIVLGAQTVFAAFFMGLLFQERSMTPA